LKKLNHILLWDDYFIEGYALFLMLLGFFHPWIFIIFSIYIYWQRKTIKIPLILIGSFLIIVRFYYFENQQVPQTIHGKAKIVEITSYEYSDLIVVKYQNTKYQAFVDIDIYQLCDYVILDAEVKQFRDQTIPFGFNQKDYYLSHNIRGYLEISSIVFDSHSFSFFSAREALDQYISKFQSQTYIKALILGEKSFSEEQTDTYRNLGILYLFTVSGLHIYALMIVINKIFFYFSLSEKKQFHLTVIIYLLILYLNAFSMSILRIVLIFVLQSIFKKFKIDLMRLDIIHLSFFIMLIFKIEWIYHLGFLMIFIILNFIHLMSHVLSKYKGYFKRVYFSTVIILSILPFQSTVSPFVIFLLPIFIGFITGPIYFLSLLTLFIPELDQLLFELIRLFESFIMVIDQKNFSIALPTLPVYCIVLYYVLLIILFRAPDYRHIIKRSTIIILLFSYFIFDINISQDIKLYMIDVGQGDSILIESPTCNLVIDIYQNVLPLINRLGIYQLDLLILTHSDNDHVMEAQSIIDHINVKRIIINPYSPYDIEHKQQSMMKSDDYLKCGDFELAFFGPIRSYDNANNNSLVFKINIGAQSFLFTGDIETEAEYDLVNKYGYQLKSDVIKVPHHGSITSTSEDFINMVDPKTALISLDENNRFGFPNQEVINRLMINQVDIYRTDQMGTICYTYHQKKGKWSFYLPF